MFDRSVSPYHELATWVYLFNGSVTGTSCLILRLKTPTVTDIYRIRKEIKYIIFVCVFGVSLTLVYLLIEYLINGYNQPLCTMFYSIELLAVCVGMSKTKTKTQSKKKNITFS